MKVQELLEIIEHKVSHRMPKETIFSLVLNTNKITNSCIASIIRTFPNHIEHN